MTSASVEHFLSQGTAVSSHSWLQGHRDAANRSLTNSGFPTRKMEDWKYTDVSSILEKNYTFNKSIPPEGIDSILSSARIAELECHDLVFINGIFSRSHSNLDALPEDVVIGSLSELITSHHDRISHFLNRENRHEKNGFGALNTSLIEDGAVVIIDNNVALDKPVNLVFVSTSDTDEVAQNIRNLIVVGTHARADVIETYYGPDSTNYFTNTVTEAYLEDGAGLNHYKLTEEGLDGYHVGNFFVEQKQNSSLNAYQVSIGGKLARSDLDINLAGPNAEATIYGLYMGEGKQHIDHHTTVNHSSPNTRSNETYRGVLGDKARGVFNGKIIVAKDAQKTEAHLSNANLLLSSEAEVDTKPELEIYADDVKCSHGATIGRLDDTMLFYLRSRAIDEEIARSLLTFAFAEDVIDKIHYPQIINRLQKKVIGKLPDSSLIKDFVS